MNLNLRELPDRVLEYFEKKRGFQYIVQGDIVLYFTIKYPSLVKDSVLTELSTRLSTVIV